MRATSRPGFWTRLTWQPSVHYRGDRYFYLRYDTAWLALFAAIAVTLYAVRWPGLSAGFQPWYLALLPVTIYLHVLANVCVHNACHGNFPRAINRLVGEVLGALVLTRYASWEILHVRHHKYSDDPDKDPHHVILGFWRFLVWIMAINLEHQLRTIHFEQFEESAESVAYENRRSVLSFAVMVALIATWLYFLGPGLFFAVFVPTQVIGWIVVAHFNWATHNAADPGRDYRPVNLDHGLYWFGNRVWFGLYMHGDHHRYPNVFNPLHTQRVLAARRERVRRALSQPVGST